MLGASFSRPVIEKKIRSLSGSLQDLVISGITELYGERNVKAIVLHACSYALAQAKASIETFFFAEARFAFATGPL